MQATLSRINYEDGSLEQLQQQQEVLQRKRRALQNKLEQKNAYRFDFHYKDPTPNFNRNGVKGRVCNLFEVKDPKNYLALSMLAGGTVSLSSVMLLFCFLYISLTVVQCGHRYRSNFQIDPKKWSTTKSYHFPADEQNQWT